MKHTHGGARPGAGSKGYGGEPRIKKSLTLEPIVSEYLATTTAPGVEIDRAVKKLVEFRKWQAKNNLDGAR